MIGTDGPRQNQHLVSKGYQRNFADGWRVAVLDARSGGVVDGRRHIKENWVVEHFLSVSREDGTLDDTLEREFAKREQRFLNMIRDVRLDAPVTPAQKAAIHDLAAAHLTRSQSFAEAHDTAASATFVEARRRLARDPRAIEVFRRQYGRGPLPGELESIVDAEARRFADEPDLFASGVRRVDPGIQQLLAKWKVQLVGLAADLPGFVLPDNPVLHGKRVEGRFGFRDAVAIGEADQIIVPIDRRLTALYSSKRLPAVEIRTKESMRWVNSLLIRSALKEVVCHPDDAQEVARLIKNLDRYPTARFDAITLH